MEAERPCCPLPAVQQPRGAAGVKRYCGFLHSGQRRTLGQKAHGRLLLPRVPVETRGAASPVTVLLRPRQAAALPLATLPPGEAVLGTAEVVGGSDGPVWCPSVTATAGGRARPWPCWQDVGPIEGWGALGSRPPCTAGPGRARPSRPRGWSQERCSQGSDVEGTRAAPRLAASPGDHGFSGHHADPRLLARGRHAVVMPSTHPVVPRRTGRDAQAAPQSLQTGVVVALDGAALTVDPGGARGLARKPISAPGQTVAVELAELASRAPRPVEPSTGGDVRLGRVVPWEEAPGSRPASRPACAALPSAPARDFAALSVCRSFTKGTLST